MVDRFGLSRGIDARAQCRREEPMSVCNDDALCYHGFEERNSCYEDHRYRHQQRS